MCAALNYLNVSHFVSFTRISEQLSTGADMFQIGDWYYFAALHRCIFSKIEHQV